MATPTCGQETLQYTFNEEYEYKVPDLNLEPPLHKIPSDSEDDSEHNMTNEYFETSSSDDSEEDSDSDYFRRFRRSATPEFLEYGNRNDDEDDDLIIPLETEDCDFGSAEVDSRGQMVCSVCSIIFKSKIRFVIHRRRHFALDHFICPVCQKGFTTLSQCQAHEYKEHQQMQDKDNPDGPKYYFRTRNARKATNNVLDVDLTDEDLISILPSTCLCPYDGPSITDMYQAYQIELKYGRNDRKSHSKIQSKYALECQKRSKIYVDEQLRKIQNRLDEQRQVLDPKSKAGNDPLAMSDDEDFTYAPKAAVAHSGAPRRNLLSFRKESRGPKCYFCSLCGFTSKDESGIHEHQNVFHPEVPVSELIHFLCVDKSQKKTKNGSEGLRRGRSRHKAKLTRNQIIRAKKLRKLEKKKEAKLFRKRKHVPRVWEKPAESLSVDEFAMALGLVRKTDVLLGPRGKDQQTTTSHLFRQRRRETSPIPILHKSICISLKKLPHSRHRRFFCCQHCNYYSASKTEIRRHRRAEHLKSLRQRSEPQISSPPSQVPKSKLTNPNSKRTAVSGSSSGSPFESELTIRLNDIMQTIRPNGVKKGDVASPPTKKTKVS